MYNSFYRIITNLMNLDDFRKEHLEEKLTLIKGIIFL